jgi:hypothetical protein
MVILGQESNSQVLRACHQIRDEAEPMLYQRPQIFGSQEELFSWLAQANWQHLHHVTALKLQLQDPDMAVAAEDMMLSPKSTTLDEYEEDFEQLDKALLQLPGVTDLRLCKSLSIKNRESYNNIYSRALRKIARWWPQLRSIAFHGCEHPLSFVKATEQIEKLCFTGFSISTPMETEGVFSRLRHLQEIEIILPQRTFTSGELENKGRPRPSLSLTRQVIKSLRGLKAFTIHDTLERPENAPAFFIPEFLQALDASHRISLRKFKVYLDFQPDDAAERALYALLASSSIKHLSVFWPAFDGRVLGHLPKTTSTLRLALPEDQPLEHLLGDILRIKEDLSSLHKLVIINPTKVSNCNGARQVRPKLFHSPPE